MFKKHFLALLLILSMAVQLHADSLFLDFDSATTGGDLATGFWDSPLGDIQFFGEFRDVDGDDLDFDAVGASGFGLDIDGSSTAELTFDFDVESFTFIYGGNIGVFDLEARDINGLVVDSFFQASTGDGESAGPVTVSGNGIRSIFWTDPGNAFAPIDNVNITTVPEPTSALLLLSGLLMGCSRRHRH